MVSCLSFNLKRFDKAREKTLQEQKNSSTQQYRIIFQSAGISFIPEIRPSEEELTVEDDLLILVPILPTIALNDDECRLPRVSLFSSILET